MPTALLNPNTTKERKKEKKKERKKERKEGRKEGRKKDLATSLKGNISEGLFSAEYFHLCLWLFSD